MLEVHISITGVAVFVVILIVVLIGLLFYLYPASNKRTTIPGPNASDEKEGNLNDIDRAGSLHQYLSEIHSDYGDIVAFSYGRPLIVSVSDPGLFAPRSQLFTLPAFLFEKWRPLVGDQSFLYASGLDVFKRRDFIDFKVKSTTKQAYAKTFRSLACELVNKWKGLPKDQHIPLSQHMKGLATKAVTQMMFGDYFADDSKVIKLHKAWELCWSETIASCKKEPTKSESDLSKAKQEFNTLLKEAIDYQWKQPSSNFTLIGGLLGASNGQITSEEMLCDVSTLFTIGQQVTCAVLTWSCYYLATNRKEQKHLRSQLKSCKSLDIMPESLGDNKTIKCILKETIRCSEMFSWNGRQEEIDITLREHLVPKQTPVLESLSVAMSSDKLWGNPCDFNPSRFISKDLVPFDPLDFIPFAFGGSRRQPQDSLVYLLASIFAASLFREFDVTLAGSDITYDDRNYEGFVVMPTTEEVWITASKLPGNKSDLEVEDI